MYTGFTCCHGSLLPSQLKRQKPGSVLPWPHPTRTMSQLHAGSDEHALHSRLRCVLGATVCHWVLVHVVTGEQTRLEVKVFSVLIHSLGYEQVVNFAQTRSDVFVGALDSYWLS